MKKEIKNKWIHALKHDAYLAAPLGTYLHAQTNVVQDGKLLVYDTFGAVGVLVELYRSKHGIESTDEFWNICWTGETLKDIERWAGFKFDDIKYKAVFANILKADTNIHQILAVWIKKYMPETSIENRLKVIQ